MTERMWLGIDLGTQGVRAVLMAQGGRVEGQGSVSFPERRHDEGVMTHDPQADWTDGTVTAVRAALRAIDTRQVAGVGVCGLFPASVLLDADGRSIGSALLYGDDRAAAYVPEVARRLNVALSGDEVSPRLLWLRDQHPDEFAAAARVVGPSGFVVHLLTGRVTIDPHSAYRWGGLVDTSRTDWAPTSLDALGVRRSMMPEIVSPSAVVGRVTATAAALTGLRPGTAVVGGTTDSFATFVGHGAVRAGDRVIYYGSTWTVMVATCDLEAAVRDPSLIGEAAPWRLVTYAVDAGRLTEQLRTAVLQAESYEELDSAAAAVPPGARGVAVIPLATARYEGNRLTASRAAILGLDLDHGRAEVWRAALESLGHLVAAGLEGCDEAHGRTSAAGSGARSALWRQIVGDVANLEQRYDASASAALGSALLAAYGLGEVASLDPIAEGWLSDERATVTRPDPSAVAAYASEREQWMRYAQAVADLP